MTVTPTRRLAGALTLFVALVSTALRAQTAADNAADAERLIKALAIQPGSIVGEVGAGGGELTIALARAVGESGRVFSNDLNPQSLKSVGDAAAKAGVHNVTLVEGREKETHLPDQCCDAVFMRNVYHHFADPAAMNVSLLASLKPGGRLAIMDFTPPPGAESATPAGRSADGHHGVTPPTVERELKTAGFTIVSSTEIDNRGFMVVAQRPAQ